MTEGVKAWVTNGRPLRALSELGQSDRGCVVKPQVRAGMAGVNSHDPRWWSCHSPFASDQVKKHANAQVRPLIDSLKWCSSGSGQ